MKVLHILENLGRGGMETLMLDMCRNAKDINLDMILVLTGDGVLLEDFLHSGIEVISIKRTSSIDINLILKLRKLISNRNIQIVHSHEPVTSLHIYLAGFGLNVKKIMSIHGIIPKTKDDIIRSFLLNRMDASIFVSKSFLKSLLVNNSSKINKYHIIHNGLDINKFHGGDRSFRKEFNLKSTDILIGMIGNFYNSGRDQLTICKMLPKLYKHYPSAYFVFIGGRSERFPSYFDECYNVCKNSNILDKTFFVGHRSDINHVLAGLDIYLYSSNHDSFGISVIEAIVSGIPVIINDLSSLLETTDNGKYVSVFKSKDIDSLFYETVNIIENKEAMIERTKNAQEWACQKYSIHNYIKNLLQLYSIVLN